MRRGWAIITTRDEEGSYYGAKATLNVWGLPSVSDRQESFSQITLRNDEDVISAGWHVFPEFYGDHDTHFYTLWVSGATPNKACYNLECEGFKRDNTSLYIPGHKIEPLSTYNGGQFEIILKIKQNNDTGDWSLYYGPNGDKPVGSWPKSLFTKLADKATTVDVGGAVLFNTGEPSPPMGSGQFSSEKAKKAAYAKDIQFVDKSGRSYKPGDDVIGEYADISHCYSISTFGNLANGFYFGGPGGCI
ncbi:uncharacterized protein LOC109832525 [Asparagus officinalis]|uniref:uncharacterized protein LOC109832525 n=1 Tax=Asparagus officinalis TaxID=4686 RepID=UPI00098E4ED1|nr:uncharacterized protein LOC109832525 [Asparagus officinalis]